MFDRCDDLLCHVVIVIIEYTGEAIEVSSSSAESHPFLPHPSLRLISSWEIRIAMMEFISSPMLKEGTPSTQTQRRI